MVQYDIVNDHILFIGHCDIYFVVQLFCYISNIRPNLRSLAPKRLLMTFGIDWALFVSVPDWPSGFGDL